MGKSNLNSCNEIIGTLIHDPFTISDYPPMILWAFRQIPLVKLTYKFNILCLCAISYFIYSDVRSHKDIYFYLITFFILLFLLFYGYFINPRVYLRFRKIYIKRSGKDCRLIFCKDGVHILTQPNSFVSWKRYKVISGKYGIAILSSSKIVLLISKSGYSDTEYATILSWCTKKAS